MSKTVLGIAIASGAAAVLSAAAPLLRPSPQQPRFSGVSSELVLLPVTVTDRHGRIVGDLPRDAFVVRDNGVIQPVAFFSHEDAPVSVGLIIDASASMRPKSGEVVAAASAFARSSNPQDDLFVLVFNDQVHDVLPNRHTIPAADIGDLEEALALLMPEGQTTLYDAVVAGLDRLDASARARKVLIVISDGADNASLATLDDALRRARRSDAQIYTIGLTDAEGWERSPRILARLAQATGGERFLPESPGLLLQTCQHIAHEIRSGYTLAYEPPARDGAFHQVRVSISPPNGKRLVIRTRSGYMAATGARP